MANDPSRSLNHKVRLLSGASPEVFYVLLDELKKWRKVEGKRGWGKQEAEVLRLIQIVTLDLYSAWTASPRLRVGYSRNAQEFLRGGRYWDNKTGKKIFSQTIFLDVINGLSATGYAEDYRAKQSTIGISSRVRGTQSLIDLMTAHGISWAAIDKSPDYADLITLTSSKDAQSKKKLIEFDDDADELIPTMRKSLSRINERLRETQINLNVSDEELIDINRRLSDEKDRQIIDFTDRYLIRKFTNGNFQSGGRFYGGWWQRVPKEYRRSIILDGLPTVEFDFKTIHPTILYLKTGITPPVDSYSLPYWPSEHRDLYKKTFNQLLNSSKTTRSPGQWRRLAPDITPSQKPDNWDELKDHQKGIILRELFIELTGRDYDELIRALLKKHEPIEHHFFSKSWSWLQRIDSDIAEKVMINLIEKHDEVILPIHDSFIVKIDTEKKSYDILLNSMEVAFEELLGVKPTIDRNAQENKEAPKEAVARMMKIVKSYQETHKGCMRRDKEWDDLKKEPREIDRGQGRQRRRRGDQGGLRP